MTAQFDESVAFILREEGGYSNDPRDPGGPTNYGVTIGDLSRWRRTTCTPSDVRNMEKSEAIAIIGAWYWSPMSCGLLPPGLDLIVLNFGYNAGIPTCARQVQNRVGAPQDGHLGPLTAATARGVGNREDLMRGLLSDEASYYRALAEFGLYGHDWIARLNRCAALAWTMACFQTPAPVQPLAVGAPTVDEADALDTEFNSGAS